MKPRKNGNRTKRKIIAGAMTLSKTLHYHRWTLRALEASSGVSFALIKYHYDSIDDLIDEVMRLSIESENLPMLAMGLACKHPVARTATKKLKLAALKDLDWCG